jgi:hypothetical protein
MIHYLCDSQHIFIIGHKNVRIRISNYLASSIMISKLKCRLRGSGSERDIYRSTELKKREGRHNYMITCKESFQERIKLKTIM